MGLFLPSTNFQSEITSKDNDYPKRYAQCEWKNCNLSVATSKVSLLKKDSFLIIFSQTIIILCACVNRLIIPRLQGG